MILTQTSLPVGLTVSKAEFTFLQKETIHLFIKEVRQKKRRKKKRNEARVILSETQPTVAELALRYNNPVIINVNDNSMPNPNAMQGHLCMHEYSIEG